MHSIFSGFHCLFVIGHLSEIVIRNSTVWPTLFLLNAFTTLEDSFYILLTIVAAGAVPGVVLCGGA